MKVYVKSNNDNDCLIELARNQMFTYRRKYGILIPESIFDKCLELSYDYIEREHPSTFEMIAFVVETLENLGVDTD